MKKWFLLKACLVFFLSTIYTSDQTSEVQHELDPQARTIIGHIFNLLADGYVIISSAATKVVKDAALLDVIKRVEELFAYIVSDKKRNSNKEEIAQTVSLLLRDERFVELLIQAAQQKEKAQLSIL